LCAQGTINIYQLFAEQFLKLIGSGGLAGLTAPTGIATDNSTQAYSILSTATTADEPERLLEPRSLVPTAAYQPEVYATHYVQ